MNMIQYLPPEASVWRKNRSSWTTDNELSAIQIEVTDALLRAFIMANSKPSSQKPKPIKIPRPYEKDKKESRTTLTDLFSHGLRVKKGDKK